MAARFVRVRNNGTASRLLHVGEFEVFPAGVTPGNNAGLSSNDVAGRPSSPRGTPTATAIPRTWSTTSWTAAGRRITLDPGVASEMVIDLNATTLVDRVRIWQRSDGCCQDRLSNFTVALLADNGQGLPGATLHQLSYPGQAPTNSYAESLLPTADASTLTKTGSRHADADRRQAPTPAPTTVSGGTLLVNGSIANSAVPRCRPGRRWAAPARPGR